MLATKKVRALLQSARRYDALAAACEGAGNLQSAVVMTQHSLACRTEAAAIEAAQAMVEDELDETDVPTVVSTKR